MRNEEVNEFTVYKKQLLGLSEKAKLKILPKKKIKEILENLIDQYRNDITITTLSKRATARQLDRNTAIEAWVETEIKAKNMNDKEVREFRKANVLDPAITKKKLASIVDKEAMIEEYFLMIRDIIVYALDLGVELDIDAKELKTVEDKLLTK